MKQLVLYDFDGTITHSDSFLPFIRFTKGQASFLSGLLMLLPDVVLFKLRIIPNWKLKEKFLSHFFKGWEFGRLKDQGVKFAMNKLPDLIRPEAMENIRKHKEKGARILVVTASFDIWVEPWANSMDLEFIATSAEVRDGYVSGQISGNNCYGPEKVKRIRTYLNLSEYDQIFCYGDSAGDREMLEIGTQSYYRSFG